MDALRLQRVCTATELGEFVGRLAWDDIENGRLAAIVRDAIVEEFTSTEDLLDTVYMVFDLSDVWGQTEDDIHESNARVMLVDALSSPLVHEAAMASIRRVLYSHGHNLINKEGEE